MAIQEHIDSDWEPLLREETKAGSVVEHLASLVARLEAPPTGVVVQEETLDAFHDAHTYLSTWLNADAGMDGWGEGAMGVQAGLCSLIKYAPDGIVRVLPEVCD